MVHTASLVALGTRKPHDHVGRLAAQCAVPAADGAAAFLGSIVTTPRRRSQKRLARYARHERI
jgi:hypothetical protein